MNDDELIFDDEFDEIDSQEQPTQQQPVTEESKIDEEPTDDLTSEVLKLKGISDPSKIKFEDTTGAIIERDWNSLTKEEQLNILAGEIEETNDLDEQEIQLLNEIRQSGLSPQEYLSQFIPQEQPKVYDIDEFSDDELYALDLLQKAGSDISDEEITEALEAAKKNENLFKRTVDGLRTEYKRLQDEEEQRIQSQQLEQQQQQYNIFANTIMNRVQNMDSFMGQPLELSQNETDNLLNFMLALDDNGVSEFGKALNNPEIFTKAAFWILNEEEITKELNNQIQENYRRGYEQAKKDLENNKSNLVITKPTSQRRTSQDEFVDDEDW